MGQGTHVPHAPTGGARATGGAIGLGPDDFEQIDRFLTVVGQGSLLEYYDLDAETADEEVEAAIQARRRWAQGQQANPKYRVESRWVIKNNALVRRVLVECRDAYLAELARREHAHGLEVLDQFLMGVLAGGRLSADAEAAVVQRGRGLGLPDAVVHDRIDQRLRETGADREAQPTDEVTRLPDLSSAPPPPGEETVPGFLDHYQTLGVPADADLATIEGALRGRYRWARTIRDPSRAARVYDSLDEAWRVLRDADARRRYDETRRIHSRQPVAPPPELADEDEDLPTSIGAFTVPHRAEARDHRAGPGDMLLGPPARAVETNPDDLLLGPPPEARASGPHTGARRRSGARVGLSSSTLRQGATPDSGARRAAGHGSGVRAGDLGPSGSSEETWPSGMLPESPTTSGARRTERSLGPTRSLPPADTLSDEPTRADPVQLEYSPSQSWALYLLGALAVVAVWAVLAIVFGWGRTADEIDPLVPEVGVPAAMPAVAPPRPAPPEVAAPPPVEVEAPVPAIAPPTVPVAAASTEPARPAAAEKPSAAAPVAEPVPPAPAPAGASEAPSAPPTAPEPVEVGPTPAEGSDAEPPPAAEPDAPEGYMGVPDDFE